MRGLKLVMGPNPLPPQRLHTAEQSNPRTYFKDTPLGTIRLRASGLVKL